jgi:hypothetical protein
VRCGKVAHSSSVALAARGDKEYGRAYAAFGAKAGACMSAAMPFFDDERYLRTVVAE